MLTLSNVIFSSAPTIGLIVLEHANGKVLRTVQWNTSPTRRAREITLADGVYAAVRINEKQQWIYRWNRPRGVGQGVTVDLTELPK